MKSIKLLASLLAAALCSTAGMAQTWDFSSVSTADQTNLAADATNWDHETGTNDRYKSKNNYTAEALKASSTELEFTKGLLFTATVADAIRVDVSGNRLALNKANTSIIIPGLAAGATVTVSGKTSSKTAARCLTATNLTSVSGAWGTTSLDAVTNVGTVTAAGDVTITCDGGFYIYSIAVTTSGTTDPSTPTETTYNSVAKNTAKNQMRVAFASETRYYNTDDVKVALDNAKGSVTVSPITGTWTDVFTGSVTGLSFALAEKTGGDVDNTGDKVKITKSAGWNNAAYIEWNLYSGATSYNVYVKGGQYSDFTKIDYQLVRNYGTYGRADALGLKAGTYEVKVVPVVSGAEKTSAANTATSLIVKDHDRSGYAFTNSHAPGAYNLDGTLKSNAVVVYVTDATKNSVTQGVVVSKTETTLTGFANILQGLKKGNEPRPFVFRIIGCISTPTGDGVDKGDLVIDLGGKTTCAGVTIEGVGNDAVANEWGIRVKNSSDVEISNLGFLNCSSSEGDNIGLQQKNSYIWVHNCDMFYGGPGGDSDQAKGDGALDCKDSNNVTFSYNHFWDNGKCNLLGLSEGTSDYYITYHHNWYDHSDSRHPRCRYFNAHVYNNYFDGNAKYGIGASEKSNVFADRNYFRNTNKPMLTKGQGTDSSDDTFDDNNAGMIKAYGNVFAEKGSKFSYITYAQDNTSFDAYEVSSPTETVPSSVKSFVGGITYRNFDTNASTFYSYTPDNASDVPSVVMGQYGAGRVEHGDFQWTFTNSTDDASYAVNSALKTAILNYKTTLKGIFDGENSGSSSESGSGDSGSGDSGSSSESGSTGGEAITTGVVSFTGSTPSSSIVTVSGNYSTEKSPVTYNGTTYTTCVKMEGATSITVTPTVACSIVLVTDGAGKKIKVDGTKQTLDSNGLYSFSATAGTKYTITKGDSINLFAIVLQ